MKLSQTQLKNVIVEELQKVLQEARRKFFAVFKEPYTITYYSTVTWPAGTEVLLTSTGNTIDKDGNLLYRVGPSTTIPIPSHYFDVVERYE